MADLINPNATPGHNEAPDYAQRVTDQMARDYAEVVKSMEKLLAEAREQPREINTDDEALTAGALIKRLRDVDSRFENVRVVEGEPYLRATNAINAFFFGLRDKIGRRNKNDRKTPAGAIDILQARINDHQDRKIAEENARREVERQAAARAAREAQEKADREARAAEEARAAAERARKPEIIEQKHEIADQKIEQATVAKVEAEQLAQKAEDARIATLAKPSDIARVRGNDESGAGVTLTVAQEPYAFVVDRTLLDKNALWTFFTDAEIEKALRQWAKTHGHRQKMAGAEIGHRNKGVTR